MRGNNSWVFLCKNTSSSSALTCAQGQLFAVGQARMFCHICLQATTAEVSLTCSVKAAGTCSTHDGAPTGFSRTLQDVLSKTYRDPWIGRGGLLHGLHAHLT